MEGLNIWFYKLGAELFQTFINRQSKLKKLYLPEVQNLDLDDLALEELIVAYREENKDDKSIARILEKQPTLRRLDCDTIGVASFNELRKMRRLEVLTATINDKVSGELENLKELNLSSSGSILRRVVLPKLVKLMNWDTDNPMESEDFLYLSRSSPNLQLIEIDFSDVNFVQTAIEHFPALKTLSVYSEDWQPELEGRGGDHLTPFLSRQNLNLEELLIIISSPIYMESIKDVFDACPNIKRVCLEGVKCTQLQILELLRNLPLLTHFKFDYPAEEILLENADLHDVSYFGVEDDNGVGFLDPFLITLFNIFKSCSSLKHFVLDGFVDWGDLHVEDFLLDEADQIVWRKIDVWFSQFKWIDREICTMELVRKPNFHS